MNGERWTVNGEWWTVKDNQILEIAIDFALDIIGLYKKLVNEKKEYVISKQLLRAGTSIGANLKEADLAISKKEFIAKAQIALKEAAETEYWLDLLIKSSYLEEKECPLDQNKSIIRILTAIIKKSKDNLYENK